MLGNLLREVEPTGRVAEAASGITTVLTIILTVAIGSTMAADNFLTVQTAEIVLLALAAFVCGIASSVVTAKLMNMVPESPIPGSAAIAPARIAGRGPEVAVHHETPNAILIHHAMGPNLAGVLSAAIAGGIILAALGVS